MAICTGDQTQNMEITSDPLKARKFPIQGLEAQTLCPGMPSWEHQHSQISIWPHSHFGTSKSYKDQKKLRLLVCFYLFRSNKQVWGHAWVRK